MGLPMIAQRIYNGESSDQIGISAAEYAGRRATLERYLAGAGGVFDQTDYLAWLQRDVAGDRGETWTPDQPSRGLGDSVAKLTHATGLDKLAHAYSRMTGKDCGCSRRQKTLNTLIPYNR